MSQPYKPFVIVHLGAGRYNKLKEAKYKQLALSASQLGIDILEKGEISRNACEAICKVVENSPLTNAGIGSNLNLNGSVECDASIIDSKSMVGTSVGALTGVKNPIAAAKLLGDDIINVDNKSKWGLAKPTFLCGSGAYEYCKKEGIELIANEDQITNKAISSYKKWRYIVHQDDSSGNNASESQPDEILNDTVGVICGDVFGDVSICSSSGGNSLKHPGRIGPAALIGPGICLKKELEKTVACCSTGYGEDIITINLSSLMCDTLLSASDNEDQLINNVIKSLPSQFPYLQSNPLYIGFVGVISAHGTPQSTLLAFAHTTESLILAYASSRRASPVVIKSHNDKVGSICTGGALL